MTLILPDGSPSQKTVETLSRDEVKRIIEFEQWARSRGLYLDLICGHCAERHGAQQCRCWGNNARDASAFKLECLHAERVYGNAQAPRREIAVDPGRKIQVTVN